MTQVEQFKKDLNRLEAERDVDKCLDYIKYLMTRVIEGNALGRAVDSLLPEYVDKDELSKLYGKTVGKAMFGSDEYTGAEREFCASLTYSNEPAEE